jgi:prepilin-type N-terminal cleavage/methylation domain-containing protein
VRTPILPARRGFTMLEMLLSMSLLLTVLGLSTRLFRVQSNAVSTQAGRLDAMQNSRFALSNLERELRMAGVGVADAQPLLVMAGPMGLTFNADLAALDTGDYSAVYVNPDADSASVDVMRTSAKITLPGTSKQYPDTTYTYNIGVPSNAETITYWLSRDSTSSRSDQYVLFRRANGRPAKVVARGIIYNASTDTVFQYWKADTSGTLNRVSGALLPITHSAPMHGSTADTSRSALTDSIKQLRVTFKSLYHDPKTNADVVRTVSQTIHLMNAGLIHRSTCGQPPLGVAPTATVTAAGGSNPQTFVTVTWSASTDDGHGEKDAERYAIYRRLASVSTFDEPIASVPAGTSSYSFNDTDVLNGQQWIYGVAVQDCTPSSSPIGSTTTITIP